MQWLFDIVTEMVAAWYERTMGARARIWHQYQQYVPSGAWTQIAFDSTSFSNAVTVDFVNNRLIIQNAGYYLCQGRVQINALVDQARLHTSLKVNGSYKDYSVTNVSRTTENISSLVSTVLYLSVGDYLELWAYHDSAPRKLTHRYEYATWLGCHRLS